MKTEEFTDGQLLEAYYDTCGDPFSNGDEWEASVVTEMRLLLESEAVAKEIIEYWGAHVFEDETPETWARRFRQHLGIVDKIWLQDLNKAWNAHRVRVSSGISRPGIHQDTLVSFALAARLDEKDLRRIAAAAQESKA